MDEHTKNLLLTSQHRFTYGGIECIKNPFDLGIMTVLLSKERPRTIIEVGSYKGGSVKWMRDLTDNLGLDCMIYSVDVNKVELNIPKALFLKGNGRELDKVFDDAFMLTCKRPLLMIDDADHSEETSYSILKFFAKWSKPNEMIVVEDGIVNEPLKAIRKFLSEEPEFEVDYTYCDFWGPGLTFFTDGYIRRLK